MTDIKNMRISVMENNNNESCRRFIEEFFSTEQQWVFVNISCYNSK